MTGGRRVAGVVAAAAAVLVVLATGAPATAFRTANATYQDAAGDSVPGMPDITMVTVSDRTDGMVTIDSTISGDLAARATEVEVFIDVDRATGWGSPETSPFDAEYYAYWRPDGGSGDWDIEHWGPTGGWTSVMPELASFRAAGDHYVLTFHRTEIGDPSGFSFLVLVPSSDVAPSTGKWLYDLGPQVFTPALGEPTAVPSRPVAGERFTLRIPCTRTETNQPLAAATVKASATVAAARLPLLARYVDAQAWIRVTIPKAAVGKLLTIRITVASGTNATAAKTLSYRVRRA